MQQGLVQRLNTGPSTMSSWPSGPSASSECMSECVQCGQCESSGGIQSELRQLENTEKEQLVEQLLQWQKLRRKVLTNTLNVSTNT